MAEKKKKTTVKKGTKAKKSTTKKKVDEKLTKKVKQAEEEKPLAIDISWAAIIVLVAFFAGFIVRGFFIPQETTTPEDIFQQPFQQVAPPISSDATMPTDHPSVPGIAPEEMVPPVEQPGETTVTMPPVEAPPIEMPPVQ